MTEEHITRIKVRGYHTDFYGHVNNARYLEFYEEGRWAWFDQAVDLRKWMQKGLNFVVVNININYRQAIKVGATIELRGRFERISGRSGTLRQEIIIADTGQVASDALVTFVIIDKNGRVVSLKDGGSEEIREFVSLLEETTGPDGGQGETNNQRGEKP